MAGVNKLSFPIGPEEQDKYAGEPFSVPVRDELIGHIRYLPAQLDYAIQNLDEHQLDTPYRPEGWTVKQLIHHIADSHINAYVRFKLGLTEDNPTIKPYDQDAWAKMADVDRSPVNISITLLHSLHNRWYLLLESLKESDWKRTVVHPERNITMTIWDMLKSYSWHSRHHLAHIMQLRVRMNWN